MYKSRPKFFNGARCKCPLFVSNHQVTLERCRWPHAKASFLPQGPTQVAFPRRHRPLCSKHQATHQSWPPHSAARAPSWAHSRAWPRQSEERTPSQAVPGDGQVSSKKPPLCKAPKIYLLFKSPTPSFKILVNPISKLGLIVQFLKVTGFNLILGTRLELAIIMSRWKHHAQIQHDSTKESRTQDFSELCDLFC